MQHTLSGESNVSTHHGIPVYLYLGRLRALPSRHSESSLRVFLQTALLSNHGEVWAREAQHQRRPFPFIGNAGIHHLRLEDGLSVRVQHELQGPEIPA